MKGLFQYPKGDSGGNPWEFRGNLGKKKGKTVQNLCTCMLYGTRRFLDLLSLILIQISLILLGCTSFIIALLGGGKGIWSSSPSDSLFWSSSGRLGLSDSESGSKTWEKGEWYRSLSSSFFRRFNFSAFNNWREYR